MTGRGAGRCRGGGRGNRHGYGAFTANNRLRDSSAVPAVKARELATLQQQADDLEGQLEELRRRIREALPSGGA
jgi:hypothetical protein